MPKRDWVDVADVIHGALERAARYFPKRNIDNSIAATLPLIRGDSVLLGQVLFNLIDNAIKYGGDEPISVYARADKGARRDLRDRSRQGASRQRTSDTSSKNSSGAAKPTAARRAPASALPSPRASSRRWAGRSRRRARRCDKRGTRITLRFPVIRDNAAAEKA